MAVHRFNFVGLLNNLLILLAFAGLTIVITYPQVSLLTTSVPFHSDPYFSIWRLAWVAHQIVRDPRSLFEANIFFPEHDTLAFSDAMLLPAAVLAPLFWARVNAVAIYNVTLLTAFAVSGFAAFLLGRRLTGSRMAGVVAGMIFAFAPYRFTHYMHLELQFVFWMPIALLLIHRMAAEGRLRDGLWLGLVMAAQTLSTLYNAMFLVTYCALVAPLLLIASPPASLKRFILSLLAGAALTIAIVAPYTSGYQRAERRVGGRSLGEVGVYSASLQSYFQAPRINRLYGSTAIVDPIWADEMNLFPGLLAVVLAAIGVVLGTGRVRLIYLAALLFTFDLSRGVGGVTYPLLYHWLPPFRALRAVARFDVLVNLSLAVLAAYGVSWLLGRIERAVWRRVAVALVVGVLIAEYASLPDLSPAPPASQVDQWLAKQPPGVIVQLPLAARGKRDSRDWLYMYEGISHPQHRMLNGYSGFAPPSYYAMLEVMESFPDDRSMDLLRERGVEYVVLRGEHYRADEWPDVLARVRARADLSLMVAFSPRTLAHAVYAVRK